MFVNVNMCKRVHNAGESADSTAILTELLQCFCEVLVIIFRMY